MSAPVVSVVIPCYNQAHYAFESALSVKNAYRGPLDVIFVNDGSTKASTLNELQATARGLGDERCKISIISQENRGLSGARNTGLDHAVGEFVQLLDCDDMLVEGKIDRQIEHFGIAGALDVSVTDCLFSNESIDIFERHSHLLTESDYDLRDFALRWERGFSLPIHCALIRSSVFARHRFDLKQRAKEDWLFWTRIAAEGARIAFLGGVGAIYRVHNSSMCRASPDLGRQWLSAAVEIDRIAHDAAPDCLDLAVEWYLKAYAGLAAAAPSAPSPEEGEQTASAASPAVAAAPEEETQPLIPRRSADAKKPRLSVIIPVYEHFEFLEKCLRSVVSQDVTDLDVVIVDDCSTDLRIKPFLERFRSQTGARVIFHGENKGVAEAQNTAIAAARGDYVAFLDCDDMLPSGALAKMLAYLDKNPSCDYVFTDRIDISDAGGFIRFACYGGYQEERFLGDFRRDLLNGMIASHLKVIRREAILQAGGFDAGVSGVQDWSLALSIAEFGAFGYLPQPLYCYRVHEKTVTLSSRRKQFQLTNVVRRRFATRYFKAEKFSPRFADGDGAHLPPKTVTLADVSLKSLPELWGAQPLVLDATKGLTHPEIWFLREFNSYFDRILWSAPQIQAALLGYVWSPAILQRA